MNRIIEKIDHSIDRCFDQCWALADYITHHPEIGGTEVLAVEKYRELLTSLGYSFTTPVGEMPHSFKAEKIAEEGSGKPRIALMCEYDALPEMGHACGHSISGAASTLAALAIADAYLDFPFQVDLIGTPDEETYGGKIRMANNHVFDEYQFALMAHLDKINRPQLKTLACNGMRVTFHGVASHASASPELGVNALNAAHLFMISIDMMRQHVPKDCQMHGIITNGGYAPNIVPDKAEVEYYYRAETMAHMELLKERMTRCAEGAAIATGCTFEIDSSYTELFAELSQLPTAMQLFGEAFDAYGMPYEAAEKPEGSTDAGNVDLVIPTFHIEIKATDVPIETHTFEFEKLLHGENGKKTLKDAAKIMAVFIAKLAESPELLDQIKAEHSKYRNLDK